VWSALGDPLLAASVYFLARSGLASALASRPSRAPELAAERGWDPRLLRGVLGVLAVEGFLAREDDGTFRLTDLGALLTDEGRVGAVVDRYEVDFPVYWALTHAATPGRPLFERVHGEGLYRYMEGHPRYGRRFQEELASGATRGGTSFATSYDFQGVRSVVDVGGGSGRFLIEILRAHPGVRGVLQDVCPTVEEAGTLAREAGVEARLSVDRESFFSSVPSGHDLYTLRWVLPDWDDAEATRILSNCASAMLSTSRLVVLDPVIPPSGPPPDLQRLDLLMTLFTEGRLRSVEEVSRLFHAAGLALERDRATTVGFTILTGVRRRR
jgi:hypothetical protein